MPAKTKNKPVPETGSDPDVTPADSGGEMVEIPFKGVTFVIPRSRDDWSIDALAWLSEGKNNLFVKYTLEIARPGQWEGVVALCPRRRDFAEFYPLFAKATQECVD